MLDRITNALNSERGFIHAMLIALAIKLALAALVPLTGDEAYFVVWGMHPDLGYYDHPPLVGWVLSLLLGVSDHLIWLRLPSILLSSIIAYCIYQLLREQDPSKARTVALLYLVAPINLLNVLITTDTPLILFSFLSAALIHRGLISEKKRDYFLAGICLGLAALSKYFIVFFGLALIIFLFLERHSHSRRSGILITLISALPFVGMNLYWNYDNCWDNILFNFVNRHQGSGSFTWSNPALYILMQLYLLTPLAVLYAWKSRTPFSTLLVRSEAKLHLVLFGVPTLLFALLSLKNLIGLHWVLSFYPFFFILLFWLLDHKALNACFRFLLVFSALHLVAVTAISTPGVETWKNISKYNSLVMGSKTDELLEKINKLAPNFRLATTGYSAAAVLAYHANRQVPVFGMGSRYGRQDDIITDWRDLQGQDLAILEKINPPLSAYAPYFESVKVRPLELRGAQFYLILGKRFNYPNYREGILRTIRSKYYTMPNWLPEGDCYFCSKYFASEHCHTQ